MSIGRIDVHSHLLPGLDDGCQSLEESLTCARVLVREGYTHSFCTPHVWPNLPNNNVKTIPKRTAALQKVLDDASIALRLLPGGEINLRADAVDTDPADLVTFAMAGKFVLIDLWADRLPAFFEKAIQWLQSLGVTVVLAHPERMRAVQLDPNLATRFQMMGILLQGNLQCLGDPPTVPTRQLAEKFLLDGRYFMLGSDLHNIVSLPIRLAGLHRALELVGPDVVQTLTSKNPSRLLPSGV